MSPEPLNPSTAQPMSPRHADPEDLTLFAMQLLSGEDADSVDNHLDRCAQCRGELARIEGDLAVYAYSVELDSPSPAARQHLMKQVAREKKAVARAPQPLAQVQAQPQPAIAAFGRSASILIEDEERKPRRNAGFAIFGWTGWLAAAALAFAAFSLYQQRDALRGTVGSQSSQIAGLNADDAQAHQLMQALTDPEAVRVTLTTKPQVKPAPVGRATYDPTKGTLIFLASNLDPLQPLKTYELWVIPANGQAPIPAGTFQPDDHGNASVILPNLPKGVPAKAFGVTIEPQGGSPAPTLPIIMASNS